jgi:hypothetical protein
MSHLQRRQTGDVVKSTGLICPECKKSAGIVENRLPRMLVFLCQACGNRWSAEEPGMKRQ